MDHAETYKPISAWSGIRRWFFDPVPCRALVTCRLVYGLILFLCYLSLWPVLEQLFGPNGIGGAESALRLRLNAAAILRPWYIRPFGLVRPLELLYHTRSTAVVWLLYVLLLFSSLGFALGLYPRASGLIALFIHTLFHARNIYAFSGWSLMLITYMLYVLASQAVYQPIRLGRAASLSSFAKHVSAWPLRLLQMNVCTMYAITGWPRVENPSWLDGRMLYISLASHTFGRLNIDWYAWKPALEILTYGILVLEAAAPIALWLPTLGKWWAVGLMIMHIGIALFSTVGWWSLLMVTSLTVFLPDAWLQVLWTPLAPKRFAPARDSNAV